MSATLVQLRPTQEADLPHLFTFQLDAEACRLAAFVPAENADQTAYLAKFRRFLLNPTIHMQSILVAGELAGSISKFEIEGEAELTYWLDRRYWGRGVATAALRQFLELEPARPLRGRVAFDNFGSRKVLENCGFVPIGTDTGFAPARQMEVEEVIYQLS
ncbi:GNAT family N-acetyltransferase [Hymenobacter yonginensis]|uniref:GNAT family N-acetyltransferase n=1 Tax=Hymenobacter yonginensis TaxID=748197 RepID=A0ABY7PU10_9BACT|nr:GNAT family N-acetyltransferase [Hymenobacter yonginensis]WBO86339.1 GNAT family N-acetyltransferase [Hymenobacter yonginensis]